MKLARSSRRAQSSPNGAAPGRSAPDYARPSDRDTTDYYRTALAHQQALLDDYAQRAAKAAIKRGGSWGDAPEDALQRKAAMEAVGSLSADRFKDAIDYGKYAADARQNAREEELKQANAARAEASSTTNASASNPAWEAEMRTYLKKLLASVKTKEPVSPAVKPIVPADEKPAASAKPPAPKLVSVKGKAMGTAVGAQPKTTVKSSPASTEKENRSTKAELAAPAPIQYSVVGESPQAEARRKERDLLNKWNMLARKSGLASQIGAHGAGWTAEDDFLREYLGVKLGYLEPVKRTMKK
jgi:hypothetical protein